MKPTVNREQNALYRRENLVRAVVNFGGSRSTPALPFILREIYSTSGLL